MKRFAPPHTPLEPPELKAMRSFRTMRRGPPDSGTSPIRSELSYGQPGPEQPGIGVKTPTTHGLGHTSVYSTGPDCDVLT